MLRGNFREAREDSESPPRKGIKKINQADKENKENYYEESSLVAERDK